MERQVRERVQISSFVRLVVFADGSLALWQGSNRVELSAFDAVRLRHTLLHDAESSGDEGRQEKEKQHD